MSRFIMFLSISILILTNILFCWTLEFREIWNSRMLTPPDSQFYLIHNSYPHTSAGTAVDMDGDGYYEIVAKHYDSSQVVIFEGLANDSFVITYRSPRVTGVGSRGLRYFQVGDVDDDGRYEIWIVAHTPSDVYVYENRGDDSYLMVWSASRVASPACDGFTIGDENSDGSMDAIIQEEGSPIEGKVYDETRDDTYARDHSYFLSVAGVWNSSIVERICDIDGDGLNELLTYASTTTMAHIAWFIFENGVQKLDARRLEDFRPIYLGDVDGDGDCEILARSGTRNDFIIINSARTDSYYIEGRLSAKVVNAHTFDLWAGSPGDEIIMVVDANPATPAVEGQIRIYAYDSASFTELWNSDSTYYHLAFSGISAGDADGDGLFDFAVVGRDSLASHIYVFEIFRECTTWIDSVWFSEETDCNDSNIVRICYRFSSTCPGSLQVVSISISPDSGISWEEVGTAWFTHVRDTIGDIGYITPGTHCFEWLMDIDTIAEGRSWMVRAELVSREGLWVVMDSLVTRMCQNRGFSFKNYPDTIFLVSRPYLYKGFCDWPHHDFIAVDSIRLGYGIWSAEIGPAGIYVSYEGSNNVEIYDFNLIYLRTINLSRAYSRVGLSVIWQRDLFYADSCWYIIIATPPTMLPQYRVCKLNLDLDSVINFSPVFTDSDGRNEITGITYAYGHLYICTFRREPSTGICHLGRIYMLDPNTYAVIGYKDSPGPVPENIEFEGGRFYISHFQHGICRIWEIGGMLADAVVANAPLDSRPPRVRISCPETTIFTGGIAHIAWHIEDKFYSGDPCTVKVDFCGRETTYIVSDTSLDIIVPADISCDSDVVIVAVRDSFCNWGYDTCVFEIRPYGYIAVSFGDTIADACRGVVIPLVVDSADCIIDRLEVVFEVDTSVVYPVRFAPAIVPAPDSVAMNGSGRTWRIEFFWSSRVSVMPGIASFLHLRANCEVSAGDFSIIDIIDARARYADVYWRDGTVIIDYNVYPWLVTIHAIDTTSGLHAEATMGANFSANDLYDPWVDLLHITPPPGSMDVWFEIDDPAHPSVTKLYRDIKDMYPLNQWKFVINYPSSTYIYWSRGALGEGFYTINGWLDMRTDTEYYAAPFETLTITWELPKLVLDTIPICPGWNLISLPLRSPKPYADFIFRSAFYGPYEYDPHSSIFFVPELIRFGQGYPLGAERDTAVIFVGVRQPRYIRPALRGWNIFGCPSVAVDTADIGTIGTSLLGVFEQDTTGMFIVPDSLRPGRGYWFLMSDNGKVVVPR